MCQVPKDAAPDPSRDPAGADGVAQRDVVEVRTSRDADRRESRFEGLLRVCRPQEGQLAGQVRELAVLPVAIADGMERQVHVRIDEARQHRMGGEVDHRGASGDPQIGAHRDPLPWIRMRRS
jgi:hypothetical protein